jgi:hypothetical protein
MSRLVRHALVAVLIAWHGAVTLCGTGLHALPGLGHDSGLSPRAKNDHTHGPGKSAHESADDCQICQMLAQGQLAPDPAAGAACWLTSGPVPPVRPAPAPVPSHRPFIARGPPPALLIPC